MKDNGICPNCEKRKAVEGKTCCEECLTKKIYNNLNRAFKGGFSEKQFNQAMKNQGGKCAICRNVLTRPNIDHSHATAEFRGILCGSCNKGLDFFKDNPIHLKNAALYLVKSTKVQKGVHKVNK